MEAEWKEVHFEDVCDVTRGSSPRPIHNWITTSGIPWVKISDATATSSRTIRRTKEHIRSDGKSRSVPVYPGDLILSNSATPGIPKFMGIEACIHDGWLLLRNFRGIDKLFAYYLLVHERAALVEQGSGSVFTNLRTDILKKHRVLLPPMAEQRRIAALLSALDDKIELNRRMAKTLEQMLESVYRFWFGHNNGPPSHSVHQGDSAARAIRTLDQLFDIRIGRTPPRKERRHFLPAGEGVPWLSIRAMGNLNVFAFDTEEGLTEEAVTHFRVPVVPSGTVLVSFKLTVGRVAIAARPMATNEAIAHLVQRPDTPVGPAYTYCFMKAVDWRALGSTSSIATAVNSGTIRAIQMPVPPTELHNRFETLANPILDRIRVCIDETSTLSQLRDTLLPQLISGELRVPEAKQLVSEIA